MKRVYVNLFSTLSPAQWCVRYMRSFYFASHLLLFIFKFQAYDFTLRVLRRAGVKGGQSVTPSGSRYLNRPSGLVSQPLWGRAAWPAAAGLAAVSPRAPGVSGGRPRLPSPLGPLRSSRPREQSGHRAASDRPRQPPDSPLIGARRPSRAPGAESKTCLSLCVTPGASQGPGPEWQHHRCLRLG